MKICVGTFAQLLPSFATLLLSAALAQPADAATVVPTGPLNTGRDSHTATLLASGKVLVVGGYANSTNPPYLSSAELFDPATGTWTTTGGMASPRQFHTATLLPNGKVLVAGGFYYDYAAGTAVSLSSAELYDPATGTWTTTSAMSQARNSHTATLLPNGKVLVAGGAVGFFPDITILSGAELYDPATGTWTTTGDLVPALGYHTATLLGNGKVLVAGGTSGVFTNEARPELYDPATGTWSVTGTLNTARSSHTATLLPNGKVLIVGGYSSLQTASAELYDPATGTWTPTGALAAARNSHTATLLPSGKVLVAGGFAYSYPAGGADLSSTELYDPATGTWVAGGTLNIARSRHTATLLPGGQVLLAAGYGGGDDQSSAELYDSSAGMWAATGGLNSGHGLHTASLLANGQVLVTGGDTGTNGLSSAAEVYAPTNGTWVTTGPMSTKRSQHTATLLANGQVLAAGGQASTSTLTNSAELYDPTAGTWTLTGPLNTARYEHTATLLTNGQVLVAGGADDTRAELYDPATRHWTVTGSLASARRIHTATLLPNGKVLVAGGYNFGSLASAELHDPLTGTWTTATPMTENRWAHTATLLPNGKVLVAGGAGITGFTSSAELYDSVAGTWTPTGSMTTARYYHTATLLPNGKVLVAGGNGGGATTEQYDPATGTWTATGPLATARQVHTATLLPNGQVLVAGGYGSTGFLAGAELYSVGLGFDASWQPQLGLLTSPLNVGSSLVLTGSGFRGISEGSCGNGQDSPADYPVVQLRSVESGQTLFLPADPRAKWSATSFTSAPLGAFPVGYALVTVFANGIPSTSGILRVDTGPPVVPPEITLQPQSRFVLAGSDVTFSVEATGTPPLSYQWRYNGTNLAAATGSSLTLSNVQANAAGSYSVLVTNVAGSVLSSNAPLTVNRAPVARCTNVVVPAGPDCHAAASVDDGSYDPDGDTITLVQSPPGPYPLGTNLVILTAMDSRGASNSCSALVIVRDTTPPALIRPLDILVEFTNEVGAAVFFTPQASDNCSGRVPVNCAPVSGSTFPIGTTVVLCAATDPAGNSATCNFQVTVLGAQGAKSNVLAELTALRTGVTRPPERQQLDEAIRHLGNSLDPALWIDQTRLDRRHGERDFDEEKSAVQELCRLLKDKRGTLPQAELQACINRIVKADRLLAFVAIQDAATAGADRKLLVHAGRKLAQGDEKVARGQYEAGIEHYREAWQDAMHLTVRITGRLVNGGLSLEFPAVAGESYVVETSTNLTHWVTLGTVTATEEGIARFDGPKAAPARFYRARLLP